MSERGYGPVEPDVPTQPHPEFGHRFDGAGNVGEEVGAVAQQHVVEDAVLGGGLVEGEPSQLAVRGEAFVQGLGSWKKPNLFAATKDYYITGRANLISCAVGLR